MCLSKFAIAISLFSASAQDYFPLAAGNQWALRSQKGGQELSLQVTQAQEFDSQTWYRLESSGGQSFWLRNTGDGRILQRDSNGQEKLWYDFSARTGEEVPVALPGSGGSASIADRAATYSGPIGTHSSLKMQFRNSAATGMQSESFLPYIGPVQRVEGTGAAAVTYDLIYSRTGKVTAVSAPDLAVSLAADPNGGRPLFRLTVRNTSGKPLPVTYASGQSYDLILRNGAGEALYTWSSDKLFPAVVRNETISGEMQYAITVPIVLRTGFYSAEAWLTTSNPPPKSFAASTGFEVK